MLMKRSTKRLAAAASCVLALAASGKAASAAVLNFDDIAVPDPRASEFVPDNYKGFDFSNGVKDSTTHLPLSQFFVEADPDYKGATSFYQNSYGAPSPANAIANDAGQAVLSISRTLPFNFTGADLSSFAGFNVYQTSSAKTITITGSKAGVPVGVPATAILSPTGYNFVTANFNNVDKVTFAAAGGTDPALGSSYLLDNFTYTEVPEPASLSLLALAGLGLLRRRRA